MKCPRSTINHNFHSAPMHFILQVVWDVDPRTTEETEAVLLDAAEEEDDEDWGALDRTVMEELARGFDENATDPAREEGILSQTVIDDMEDMFA